MPADFNRVVLLGSVGNDLIIKTSPSGSTVLPITLKVVRRWRNQAGELREEPQFLDCVAFGRYAEVIAGRCRKGSPLFIEGRLRAREWENAQGQKQRAVEVEIEYYQFPGGLDQYNQFQPSSERAPRPAYGGQGQGSHNYSNQGNGNYGPPASDVSSGYKRNNGPYRPSISNDGDDDQVGNSAPGNSGYSSDRDDDN